jgi:hypothetical protein
MQNTTDQAELNNQLVALKAKLTAYLHERREQKWSPFDTKVNELIIVGGKTLFIKFKPVSEGLQPMEVPYIAFMSANNLKEEDLG